LDTGNPCHLHTSTCPDARGRPRNAMCHARGPGWEKGDKESTRIIGLRQYMKARELFQSAEQQGLIVSGPVQSAHAWIEMSNTTVRLSNGQEVTTCPPARGFSFAAGRVIYIYIYLFNIHISGGGLIFRNNGWAWCL
jgi:neutral ceramidase